jgi:hypothetical protein
MNGRAANISFTEDHIRVEKLEQGPSVIDMRSAGNRMYGRGGGGVQIISKLFVKCASRIPIGPRPVGRGFFNKFL